MTQTILTIRAIHTLRKPTMLLAAWWLLVLSGCPPQAARRPATPPAEVSAADRARPEIHSISETGAYTALAIHDDFVYAGTAQGLVRFALSDGQHVRLTTEHGLAGNRITALSSHPTAGLWVASEGGISRFVNGVWTNVSPGMRTPVTTMVATRNHLWAGGPGGLRRLALGARTWRPLLPGVRVTHLVADFTADGVWIGTDGEGAYRSEGDRFASHAAHNGQPLYGIRALTLGLDGGLFAVGETTEGDRLVFFDGRHWTTYQPDPPGELHWVTRVGRRVLLACGDRVFEVRRADLTASGPHPLPRGPVTLSGRRSRVAPPVYPIPYFFTVPLGTWLPPDPTVLEGQGDRVLVGTRTTGALVFDGARTRWFRTSDLVGPDEKLKMACVAPDRCLLAGNGRAYRYDGQQRTFVPFSVDPDSTLFVQGFATDGSGGAVVLHSPADRRALSVARWDGTGFRRLFEHPVDTPGGGGILVRFARYAPGGELWVGLSYLGRDDEQSPWGVVVIGTDGKMIYHRSTLLPIEDRPAGSLALPDDIRDVIFADGAVWVATDSGVCRLRGSKVDLFTENDGLESEITYGLATSTPGEILVATYAGVGRHDGRQWRFDLGAALDTTARAVAADGDALWAGTDRGLVRLTRDAGGGSGAHELIGPRDGLAGAEVRDIVIDEQRSALWVLTDRGLSLVKR